jgi:hypothetical protein
MNRRREINLKAGRQSASGEVRLSALIPGQLTLSVSYKGERASTVTLTREQVHLLRCALAEMEPLTGPSETNSHDESRGLKIAA